MRKTRTQKYYEIVVAEDLLILYNCDSIMQLPQMQQAVLSISSKRFLTDKQDVINALMTLYVLTGQKGVTTRSRKSISAFAIRKNSLIGCVVTLRRTRMYALFDKVITLLLPRLQNQWLGRKTSTLGEQSSTSSIVDALQQVELEQRLRCTYLGSSKADASAHARNRYGSRNRSKSCLNFGIKDPALFPEIEKLFEILTFSQAFNISLHQKQSVPCAFDLAKALVGVTAWNSKQVSLLASTARTPCFGLLGKSVGLPVEADPISLTTSNSKADNVATSTVVAKNSVTAAKLLLTHSNYFDDIDQAAAPRRQALDIKRDSLFFSAFQYVK